MQRYDRSALVLDTADSRLGTASLALITQGIDPLYAGDADEAYLLACEHRERLAALVVPGALPLDALDLLIARLGPLLPIGAGATVVVAPPRERMHLVALRERKVRWVVWEPYDERELRFVVAAALATGSALEPRRGLRIPVRLPVSLRGESTTREGEVRNLSVGGAFVALPDPPEVGIALELELPLGERLLRPSACVVHRQSECLGGRAEPQAGMGVCFTGLSPLDERLLEGFVQERIDSFRI